ncbi:MAG: chemotaxis protein CheA [Candidatus Sedimenticola sp. (ex Thyasira tokunagai)]
MAIGMDDEILQDFLAEAGDILEQLNEQLVDLEQDPGNFDLLNAVFRGFHTIKGGAGFLNIDAMVTICHRAEDVFNALRQGQRRIDPSLMDVVLRVLDLVNDMFAAVKSGSEPEHAPQELIDTLASLSLPDDKAPDEKPPTEDESAQFAEAGVDDAKLAEPVATEPSGAESDEITEDEFDALLDQLHGAGKHGGVPVVPLADSDKKPPPKKKRAPRAKAKAKAKARPKPKTATATTVKKKAEKKNTEVAADEITEDEFEALLDELHGKGKFIGVPSVKASEKTRQIPPQSAAPKRQKAEPAVATGLADKEVVRSAPGGGETGRSPAAADNTIRVETARLDSIMNMVGELVLVRNRLENLKDKLGDGEVANAVANLDVVTSDLQDSVMKTRMQPVKKVFGRFPRVIRDMARSLKKEIDLELNGEETDLDKNLVEALADPMVHLVRNAVDHGIESPDDREWSGKSRRGKVVLSAAQKGDHIILSIADDGRGMDPEQLRKKAVANGMMSEDEATRLSEKECYNLIFQAGFSTKTEISDVSGRGVGMDVVKTRITQMNGSVDIESEKGKGSTIIIRLPLTLAILPTLMVMLAGQPFALPLANVVEIFNLDLTHSNTIDGQLTLLVRDRALPLFYLSEWLAGTKSDEVSESSGHVVVVNVAEKQVGLVVDGLVGQEEVVIKPLGALLQGLGGMAGATITGDGSIALILDVPGLVQKYARRH